MTEEYLSILIFVHTKVLKVSSKYGRPNLDICPKFRSFYFWDPLLSEYQEVIALSSTKYEEKNRVQCMIVEEKFSEIQAKNFLMIKCIMLNG